MHFHRAKYIPKGGPDGGNGGRGGHVILKGNSQLWTMLHLRYTKHIMAKDGDAGSRALRTGADGKDIYIEVPLGTIARYADSKEMICEITEHDQTIILFEGGRGGMGNDHFKSSVNQTPKYAQPGESGIEAWIILELKLLADVGLVGFPNAGKSTLLSVVSAAKPKIADYPFTTLQPNLGIVAYRDNRSFVMADIPGIIEGAHEGKGLGLRFLRHIERNSILLFLIPADSNDIVNEYNILLRELQEYNPDLLHKPRLLAITKTDLISLSGQKKIMKLTPDIPVVLISSLTNKGITDLKDKIWKLLSE